MDALHFVTMNCAALGKALCYPRGPCTPEPSTEPPTQEGDSPVKMCRSCELLWPGAAFSEQRVFPADSCLHRAQAKDIEKDDALCR